MEERVPHLMKRLSLSTCTTDLCDFTLEEQANGITVSTKPNSPVVGKSVNYIVAFVLINDDGEVLMMQEARESCRGKWYLPAGRMEEGETIEQAAQREVLEETGLVVEITTLLTVETAGGSWIRFVLTGNEVGGDLKSNPDAESLQAQWIKNVEELPLRSQDVLGLISYAREYKTNYSVNIWPRDILPTAKSHTKNYLRLICTIKCRRTNRFQLLYSERDESHFPLIELHPERNLYSTLIKYMKVSEWPFWWSNSNALAGRMRKRLSGYESASLLIHFLCRKSSALTHHSTGHKVCYRWSIFHRHGIWVFHQRTESA